MVKDTETIVVNIIRDLRSMVKRKDMMIDANTAITILEERPEKFSGFERDSKTTTFATRVQCSPN